MDTNLRQLIREKAIHDEHLKRRSLTIPASSTSSSSVNAENISFLQSLDAFMRSKETVQYADLCTFLRQLSFKSDTLFDLLCAEVNVSEGSFAIKNPLDFVNACVQVAEVPTVHSIEIG